MEKLDVLQISTRYIFETHYRYIDITIATIFFFFKCQGSSLHDW